MTAPPKYPENYLGSPGIFRTAGRRLKQTPCSFTDEQMAFIREQANRERLPISFIIRRCVQAVMQRYEELYGSPRFIAKRD